MKNRLKVRSFVLVILENNIEKKTTENLRMDHVKGSVLQGNAPSKAAASKKPQLLADPPVMAKRHAGVKQEIALLVIVQNLTVQKEVVQRIVAPADSSEFSRLSVMLQWRYAMEKVLEVGPECFDPAPKVHSAVVRMTPLATVPQVNPARLSELVQVAFSQRRKLMRNTLGPWLDNEGFAGAFDLQRRAQEVGVDEYVALARQLDDTPGIKPL